MHMHKHTPQLQKYDLDVMIEAKAKELALFNLKKNDAERLTAAA